MIREQGHVGADPRPKSCSSRAKSNHQRGYRTRNTIIRSVARNSPPDSRLSMMAIGMTKISRKNVVSRLSLSG